MTRDERTLFNKLVKFDGELVSTDTAFCTLLLACPHKVDSKEVMDKWLVTCANTVNYLIWHHHEAGNEKMSLEWERLWRAKFMEYTTD